MRPSLTTALLLCLSAAPIAATGRSPAQYIFQNPSSSGADSEPERSIPTSRESAVLARRMLRLERIATLSTVFPSSASHPSQPGSDLGGSPIGLMDYYGDCEPASGNPTLLAVSIATSFRNEASGSNLSLAVRWHPDYRGMYSAVSMPRFSLIGSLEKMSGADQDRAGVAECFMAAHPDAVTWFPGNQIHRSEWARLVVREIFWVGGFGDRAYIGWIPLREWRSVTAEEIEKARLPGEKGRGDQMEKSRLFVEKEGKGMSDKVG
ncbi:MAG: hypothetical protein M1826_002161 [Phylliscum demangeonii]|nr:MAG: hypothetical protein M1826_002161 [Phylliscum demangeonii]